MKSLKAVALANNASVILVWIWDQLIADCLGFSIRRIDSKTGKSVVLSSRYVKFKGELARTEGDTSTHPIQGCKWIDGEALEGGTYRWEITPMLGKPGNLRPGKSVTTNEVTLGVDYGPFVRACFNRGHLVSSQKIASLLPKGTDGKPDPIALVEAINDPKSKIARFLGASLPAFIKEPYEEAKRTGGHVLARYYELAAPFIVDFLVEHKDVWSMILANAGKNDETNAATRQRLHDEGCDLTDRFLPSSSLGHDKSAVLLDRYGKPVLWALGSVNPTSTGFFTQANCALQIRSPEFAAIGAAHHDLMLADCSADPMQSDELRAANAVVMDPITLGDGTKVQALFSPSTKSRSRPKIIPGQPTFPLLDLAVSTRRTKEILLKAKQGIYFLAFYPGAPSFLDVVTWLQKKRPRLFIRGAVSSARALPRNQLELSDDHFSDVQRLRFGGPIQPIASVPTEIAMFNGRKKTPTIIAAAALENGWQDWHSELLKLPDAHAIIHTKVIVVDPFGADPYVIGAAGDNLGMKAGFFNDDTMLVMSENRLLVQAYFTHIMDVYSHFMWRYLVSTGRSTFTGELDETTEWQKKYLSGRTHDEYASWVAGAV
ncbi:MAG: hypothetical protein JST44_18640 [Cyanobacteria bacterium SZAS LIN-5]|nr:hypothetical protein [Cyanobacteria bacterium SZAS LIN-5]